MIQTEAEQGISFEEISKYQQMMADIVRRDPAVIDFFSRVSGSNGGFNGGPNFGLFFLHLKPHAERDRLDVIDAANTLDDIALPHFILHELKGDRKGTWTVKINKNWRVTFTFTAVTRTTSTLKIIIRS